MIKRGRPPKRGPDGVLLSVPTYVLKPEEDIFGDELSTPKTKQEKARSRKEAWLVRQGIDPNNRPLVGKGSGRKGGSRARNHKLRHTQHVGAQLDIIFCPICKYGMEVWALWKEGQQVDDEARAFFEAYEGA